MSATERRRGPGLDPQTLLLFGVLGVALWAGLALALGVRLGYAILGIHATLPGNPIALAILAVRGKVDMPPAAIICTAAVAGIFLGLAVSAWLLFRHKADDHDIDAAAPYMGRGRELDRLRARHVADEARRLGVQGGVDGLPIGRTVAGHHDLYADWESGEVMIAGTRTGKTVSRAIPSVLEAPGAVVVTSNRRDLVDATRDPRAAAGGTWVFDPQKIIGELPSFYWDPLTYVTSGPDGSEVKAQRLAAIFAAANPVATIEAKTDRFFDPAGQELLGHLLHAAALERRPITDVYGWVTRPTDTEPARILDRYGFGLSADSVREVIGAPDKQRGGIYGTAKGYVSFLTNVSALEWITPQPGRPTIDPHGFAMGADTLYLLSREGRGTLAPLTTSLTAAVCEAAETVAQRSSYGRLPTPLVVVLDEVANVCRWPELPELYSHYGGRGIYLLSILQSWSQGVDVWGRSGMTKLWSAATIRIYGGGASEGDFLRELAALCGHFRPQQQAASYGRDRSVNVSEGHEQILDMSDLGSLRRDRAVLFASGVRPTLIEPRPWFRTRWRTAVEASIAAHDPAPVP